MHAVHTPPEDDVTEAHSVISLVDLAILHAARATLELAERA